MEKKREEDYNQIERNREEKEKEERDYLSRVLRILRYFR